MKNWSCLEKRSQENSHPPEQFCLAFYRLREETPLPDAQKELMAIGQASGNTLLRRIKNILDYSKIAANGIALENIALQNDPNCSTSGVGTVP